MPPSITGDSDINNWVHFRKLYSQKEFADNEGFDGGERIIRSITSQVTYGVHQHVVTHVQWLLGSKGLMGMLL